MTIQQKLSASFIGLTFLSCLIFPDHLSSSSGLILSVSLYAWLEFLSRRQVEKSVADDRRLKDIEEKIQALMVGKGFGR